MKWAPGAECKPLSCHVSLLSHSYLKVLPETPGKCSRTDAAVPEDEWEAGDTSGRRHGMLWS